MDWSDFWNNIYSIFVQISSWVDWLLNNRIDLGIFGSYSFAAVFGVGFIITILILRVVL